MGVLFDDPVERAKAADVIVAVVPPLRDLISVVLADASAAATPLSIIGAVGLAWGMSRFVLSFDTSIAMVTGGRQRGSLVGRNLGALAAAVLLVAAIVLSSFLSAALEFLETGSELGIFPFVGFAVSLALGALPVALTLAATVLVYRTVPAPAPSWRSAVLPGIVVGIVLTLVARAFAFLAPRLIGAAAVVGTMTTAFAALAWLSLTFQALLIGATWARDRAERSGALEPVVGGELPPPAPTPPADETTGSPRT